MTAAEIATNQTIAILMLMTLPFLVVALLRLNRFW